MYGVHVGVSVPSDKADCHIKSNIMSPFGGKIPEKEYIGDRAGNSY